MGLHCRMDAPRTKNGIMWGNPPHLGISARFYRNLQPIFGPRLGQTHPLFGNFPHIIMESRYIGICLIIGKIIDIDIIVLVLLVLLVLLILPKFVGDLKDISAKCWKWRKIYRKDDRYQKIYLSPNPTHNPVYRSWSVGFTIDPYLIFVTCGAGVKFFSLVSTNQEWTCFWW